jgi:hypothetical protein
MNDVSIIDLFWLILKLLAALGLVGLLGVAFFLVAKGAWNILVHASGGDASVARTVLFCIAVVVLLSCAVFAVNFFYPNFLHQP